MMPSSFAVWGFNNNYTFIWHLCLSLQIDKSRTVCTIHGRLWTAVDSFSQSSFLSEALRCSDYTKESLSFPKQNKQCGVEERVLDRG